MLKTLKTKHLNTLLYCKINNKIICSINVLGTNKAKTHKRKKQTRYFNTFKALVAGRSGAASLMESLNDFCGQVRSAWEDLEILGKTQEGDAVGLFCFVFVR